MGASFFMAVIEHLRSYTSPPLMTSDPALMGYLGRGRTYSGANVTEGTALTYSAFWAAVRLIANSVAALPLFLYRRLPAGGKERFTGHPLNRLLHDDFNPEMSSVVARQTLQQHALVWGNGYAEIERSVSGAPLAIWPITPDRVIVDRQNGRVVYRVAQSRGPEVVLQAEDVLHIPGLGFDGLKGYSVVQTFRETIGLPIATQRYGAQFFGNGAVSSLAVSHPGTLSDTAQRHLKESLNEAIAGERKHSVLVLEENIKVERISIPPDDAQFLETQKFSVSEIARIFGVPPHMIGDLERATFSNIEHQAIEFVVNCLRPWLVIWEAEYRRKLIRPLEQQIQFAEHVIDGLLRGDTASRYAAYAIGRQWGWLSPDDVRELENMNPIAGGNTYLVPINMMPADRLDEWVDKQVEPTPAPRAPEPAPQRSEEQREQTRAAQHALIVEDMGRCIRREGESAKRKKTKEALAKWAETFYPKQAEFMQIRLEPVVRTFRKDSIAVTQQLVSAYIAESKAALLALPSVDLIDAHMTRWEIQRPPLMADALMAEEVKHAA